MAGTPGQRSRARDLREKEKRERNTKKIRKVLVRTSEGMEKRWRRLASCNRPFQDKMLPPCQTCLAWSCTDTLSDLLISRQS